MLLSDFDFDLPEELIATRPAIPRSSARLLVANGSNINDSFVEDLPKFLKAGDRLVFNDTNNTVVDNSSLQAIVPNQSISQVQVIAPINGLNSVDHRIVAINN